MSEMQAGTLVDAHCITLMWEARYDEAQHAFNQAPTRENGMTLDRVRASMMRARDDERKRATYD